MRVLLVEDDPVAATIVQALLRETGYTCDVADLGEIGLTLAESYCDYDVIVLDLVLPDLMGYDLIRSLRAAGVDTPILIVSSLRGGSEIGLDLGANDFLPKPFEEADLIARIRALAAQLTPPGPLENPTVAERQPPAIGLTFGFLAERIDFSCQAVRVVRRRERHKPFETHFSGSWSTDGVSLSPVEVAMPEPEHIDRRRAALIAYDVCRRALTPSDPARKAALRPVLDAWVRMIATARAAGLPVIYTTPVSRADGADVVMLPTDLSAETGVPPLTNGVEGSAEAGFPDEIAPRPEDYVFLKRRPSAFYGTGVAELLHMLRRDTIIIGGGATNRGVETSVREAFNLDLASVVVRECCWGSDAAAHAYSLDKAMKMYARIRTLDQVAAMLRD